VSTYTKSEASPGCHPVWEQEVYGRGRQLNRYPYHAVVSFVFRSFGNVADRSSVRLLELGCGAGNNLWFAAREGFDVAGIDGSVTAIGFAKERFAQDELRGDLRVGCFSALPWEDDSFDAVIDRGALTCVRRSVIENALD
jgi:2-polyprenyl-3-methyl-5-hydroxy-6-metoxy-1,4-benzoquinol methylase